MSTRHELETSARPTHPWCLFQGLRRAYAVGLESVVEVVDCEHLVRLPHGPPRVLGLCALRRELLPVIGLDRDEEPGSDGATGRRLVLVLRTGRGTWAVPVAGEGTAVAHETLDEPCPPPDTAAPWLTFLGTVRRGETVHAAIDLETTWAHVRNGVETYYSRGWLDASATKGGLDRAARAGQSRR